MTKKLGRARSSPLFFMPTIWTGDLLSASDVERIADVATLIRNDNTDFSASAAQLNLGIQEFATLSQGVAAAGKTADWFGEVVKAADRLVALLADTESGGAPDVNQAMTAFLVRRPANVELKTDPADLDVFICELQALRDDAAALRAFNRESVKPGKTPDPATNALASKSATLTL